VACVEAQRKAGLLAASFPQDAKVTALGRAGAYESTRSGGQRHWRLPLSNRPDVPKVDGSALSHEVIDVPIG
jgi:hypothetical protein